MRARYFDLYDLAPVGYFTISEKGLILEGNLTATSLLGVPRNSLARRLLPQFIFKEDHDIYYLHRKQLVETNVPQSFELRMLKGDGTVFWAHLAATAGQDPSGVPLCHIIISDITERKDMEEAFIRLSREWQRTFDSMSEAIWILDKDNIVLRSNKAAELYFHRPCAEMVGKHCWEIAHGMLEPISECPTMRVRKSLRHESTELQIGGNFFHVAVDPTLDADGKFAGAVHVVTDITERKQTEKELERMRLILLEGQRIAHQGSFEYIVATGETVWSDEEFRIYGLEPGSQSPSFTELMEKHFHPDDAARVAKELAAALQAGLVFECEHRIVRLDGSVRDICNIAQPYFDDQCNLIKYIGVTLEITERKLEEKEKEKLEAQLSQSRKMEAIGQLAGGIAHDFNNMLSIITGYSQMALKCLEPSDPNYAYFKAILDAGHHSADLTRQLLAFASKQIVAPKVLDLNDTIASMLKMLQRLIGENIQLTWKPAANLWKIKMDPSQIDQILANLLVNARDAISDVGKVTIVTANTEVGESFCKAYPDSIQGKYVVLSVSDNGCGMEKKTLEHIFEPFFTTKEFGKGTGLGLATVFGIVKQNNGFINASSEPGKGTTFKIYLPRHVSENAGSDGNAKVQEILMGTETVLLVEDEESMCRIVKVQLEGLGYTVLSACIPPEAIMLAEEYKGDIHLLLIDVVMPEMSGRDLRDRIISMRPDIKCLFMSGYTIDIIAGNGVLHEGIHFIQKPFSAEVLSAKLRKALAS